MKRLLIQSKKGLATITGILFFATIVNSVSETIPTNYVEAKQNDSVVGNLSISTSVELEERVIVRNMAVNEIPTYTYQPDSTKVRNVREYLEGRNSPLAQYAEVFVEAADHYGIDYRIIAAISIIESSGGKHNFRPHNAWGWGRMTFSSWEEGIWTVSKGIGGYYSRGLTTPKLISTYYCPPNAQRWAQNVELVMNLIGN
jgi:hypothetical protein